jgi:hypothetical protein
MLCTRTFLLQSEEKEVREVWIFRDLKCRINLDEAKLEAQIGIEREMGAEKVEHQRLEAIFQVFKREFVLDNVFLI